MQNREEAGTGRSDMQLRPHSPDQNNIDRADKGPKEFRRRRPLFGLAEENELRNQLEL